MAVDNRIWQITICNGEETQKKRTRNFLELDRILEKCFFTEWFITEIVQAQNEGMLEYLEHNRKEIKKQFSEISKQEWKTHPFIKVSEDKICWSEIEHENDIRFKRV